MFQRYIPGEDKPNEIIFHVTVGGAKKSDFNHLYPYLPAIKYVKHDKNTCYFSWLSSDMYDYIEHVVEKAIYSQL